MPLLSNNKTKMVSILTLITIGIGLCLLKKLRGHIVNNLYNKTVENNSKYYNLENNQNKNIREIKTKLKLINL